MNLFIKLLCYGIIMTLVSFLVKKTNFNTKKDVNGELYFDYKLVSRIFFICAIILSVIFIIAFSFPSNIEENSKTIVTLFVTLFNMIFYCLSYIYNGIYIRITDNKIVYNIGFGTKELLYSEITKTIKNSSGDILLYKNNKKIVTIPKDLAYAIPKLQCNEKNENDDKNEFIMQVSKFYKALMIICCIVFIMFFILSAYYSVSSGVIIFGIMLIISLIECINEFKLKIFVSKREINKVSLFCKKNILIKNITKVEVKKNNNANWLYLYSKNGLEIKINTLYTNSYLLEEILKNKIDK